MKKALIFGGSSGLGLAISKLFDESNSFNPIILSRNNIEDNELSIQSKTEYCDLSFFTTEEYIHLFEKYYPIESICFSQRYRNFKKKLDKDFLEEYKVMVLSIKKALEAFNEVRSKKSNQVDNLFTRILIIGSTYSDSIGLDQDWSYHACKSSQLSLVRYYALRSNSNFNINMLSPATYIKKEKKKYLEDSSKAELWSKYPPQRLANVQEIALEAFNLLTASSIFNNGNNIFLDAGIRNLYHDQTFD